LGTAREEYFRLVWQGMSSRAACQVVGVSSRTGKRWRNGYTAYPRSGGKKRVLNRR